MKVWVTGATGMLGWRVVAVCEERNVSVVGTAHSECAIDDLAQVTRVAAELKPDVIINCAGKVPGSPVLEMIAANALGPHTLATLGIRMIHMSTDCVFSGHDTSPRCSNDRPDPSDIYGRSKLAGEVQAEHVLNVRGSFIGPEGGFLYWLLNAKGKIEAWEHARWNGTTAYKMAQHLVDQAIYRVLPEDRGARIVHISSSEPVTKGWMVRVFVDALELPVKVVAKQAPWVDRFLWPDIELPSTSETLRAYAKEMKKCPTPA